MALMLSWFIWITITIESVTKQGVELKVIYCCKWEYILTAVVAMSCFIWKLYVLGISITYICIFNVLVKQRAYLMEFLYLTDFPHLLQADICTWFESYDSSVAFSFLYSCLSHVDKYFRSLSKMFNYIQRFQ